MVFSSSVFLFLFLPLVLTLHLVTPRPLRNVLLFVASLFFYMWGEKLYVGIMLVATAIDYLAGLAITQRRGQPLAAKRILIVALTLNLLLLGYFKYAEFMLDNLNGLLALCDLPLLPAVVVHLPIGISFFTFQSMSYVIDVYRGEVKAQVNPLNNGLYIALFPQLIAGPIVRYADIAAQLSVRRITLAEVHAGIIIFVIGLGKKMLLANPLGEVADQIFAVPAEQLTFALSWLGLLSYTLQIYFDFSGYSDMALGLGNFFGFSFPRNFNYPYVALSLRDFWRRWHISLSTWFRDYVYIPLGGNKGGPARTRVNLLVVFFLCGLWHGASWNFVLWGLVHGFFLILERERPGLYLERLGRPLRHAYVLLVVMLAWVLFRSPSLTYAAHYLLALLGGGRGDGVEYYPALFWHREATLALLAGGLGSLPLWPGLQAWWQSTGQSASWWRGRSAATLFFFSELSFLGLILLACAMRLAAGTHNPFIYFRF